MRTLIAVGLVLALLNVLVLYGIVRQLRHRVEVLEASPVICGDLSPRLAYPPGEESRIVCDLRADHASWHSGDQGNGLPRAAWKHGFVMAEPEPAGDPLDGLTEGELRALGTKAFDRADELELARRNPRAET